MPTIATGTETKVIYAKETTWGEKSSATGKYLRRVSADFNVTKETYQSEELSPTMQVSDMRHGVKRAEGSLNGEFSPGSYADFFSAAVRENFATVTAPSASAVSVSAPVNGVYTLSAITSNTVLKVGMVVKLTGSSVTTQNNKNLLITEVVSATSIKCILLNPSSAAMGSGASGTATTVVNIVGKVVSAPKTDHKDIFFSIEQWYSGITQSETYLGMKVNTVGVSIPATGMATVDFGFMGKDMITSTSQQLTVAASPNDISTSGIFAGVNGAVLVNGTKVAVITDASININNDLTDAVVLGSNSIADVFEGRITVDGSMSVYFQDATFRDYFLNETEVTLVFALTTSNTDEADFTTITLPRVKLGSFTKADAMDGIIASCDFTALLQGTNTAGKQETTIMIQDSKA